MKTNLLTNSLFTNLTAGNTLDSWAITTAGTTPATLSLARANHALPLPAGVPNDSRSYATVTVASAGTLAASTQAYLYQLLEDAAIAAGANANLQFFAKSSVVGTIGIRVLRVYGTGGSPSSSEVLLSAKAHLTTDFKEFNFPVAITQVNGKTFGSNGDSYISVELWFQAGATTAPQVGGAKLQPAAGQIFSIDEVNLVFDPGAVLSPNSPAIPETVNRPVKTTAATPFHRSVTLLQTTLAAGTIQFEEQPTATDALTLGDGSASVTFEFVAAEEDATEGNVPVVIGVDYSATATALYTAIGASAIASSFTLVDDEAGTISLTSTIFGTIPNVAITTSGATPPTVGGMTGGTATTNSQNILVDDSEVPLGRKVYIQGFVVSVGDVGWENGISIRDASPSPIDFCSISSDYLTGTAVLFPTTTGVANEGAFTEGTGGGFGRGIVAHAAANETTGSNLIVTAWGVIQ